jgi:sugar-specific transcriptional regulator TrmB
MCNEKCKNRQEHESTLNILLYRIDKIEEERRRENKDIMNLLHNIQEGQTEINKELAVHDTKISGMIDDIETLKNDKVDLDQFNVECHTISKRLDIYKNIIMAIAGGVGVSLLIEFFKII